MSDMTDVASDSTWFSARYQRDVLDLTHSVASDMREMHMSVTGEYAPKSYQVELQMADRICGGAGVLLPDRRQLSLQIVVLEGLDR
ncbi:MAG: hypothetical protein ACRDP9_25170 [Kribbellaceae bacterium]